jgi:2,4-dienoyl-CoA reductase (NADPH2)
MVKTGASMMSWHEDELHMNPTTLAFYESLARGGVGLLIVEAPILDYPYGARWKERYRIDDDKYIEGLSELAQVIHKYGCPAFVQFEHDGPWQSPLFHNAPATFQGPPIGASPIKLDALGDFHRDVIRELTISEIKDIIEKVVKAAERVKKAGFDGIDINAASSHLLHNFLSPFWNRRQDEYGGSLEKRARLLLEVVRGIKERNGEEFPVMVCINGIEIGQAIGIDNHACLTFEESKKIAVWIQEAGGDGIHIRSHWLGYHACGFLTDYLFYPEAPIPLSVFPEEYNWKQRGAGANLLLSAELKKILSIPVMVVGKMDPALGEKALREGKADLIAMNRRFMADPELPKKLVAGKYEDIAPCTACGTCLDQGETFLRHCRINADMGTPHNAIQKAVKRKNIVVIGGGPAGMEAARVAAIRGHTVTLYERSKNLGGLLPMASFIKGVEMENIPDLIKYMRNQVYKSGVKIELGKEFNASTLNKISPDAVIVATGGNLVVPEIAGLNNPKVLTAPELHYRVKPYLNLFGPRIVGWLTRLWLPVGKNVVIIGGGLHGCEIAEFLIKRNRKVTIVEKADTIGQNMIDFRLGLLLGWFEKKGVRVITGVKSLEIIKEGLDIIDRDGKKHFIPADNIIPTRPLAPDLDLYKSLEAKVQEIFAVGDCREPRKIVHAIAEGHRIARNL